LAETVSSNRLQRTLVHAKPHFVRCLRPNEHDSLIEFDRVHVAQQVKPAKQADQGSIFRKNFPGKISGKIPWKFSPKNVGKNGIFRRKSFEKSFFQEIPRNFPRKVIFRGKKCTKNRPQITKFTI
jgi:hypothetical protein